MIFDGMRWVRCRSVVVLPYEMWHGEHKNYAMFGKISKKSAKGAVKTGSVYRHSYPRRFWEGDTCPEPDMMEQERGRLDNEPFDVPAWIVYAVPVPMKGHSLTHLMYAKNGYSYLVIDGRVYVRGPKAR